MNKHSLRIQNFFNSRKSHIIGSLLSFTTVSLYTIVKYILNDSPTLSGFGFVSILLIIFSLINSMVLIVCLTFLSKKINLLKRLNYLYWINYGVFLAILLLGLLH